jgi:hypothetical protein
MSIVRDSGRAAVRVDPAVTLRSGVIWRADSSHGREARLTRERFTRRAVFVFAVYPSRAGRGSSVPAPVVQGPARVSTVLRCRNVAADRFQERSGRLGDKGRATSLGRARNAARWSRSAVRQTAASAAVCGQGVEME